MIRSGMFAMLKFVVFVAVELGALACLVAAYKAEEFRRGEVFIIWYAALFAGGFVYGVGVNALEIFD